MSASKGNRCGGYKLPRPRMVADNRAGDQLLLYVDQGVFRLSRNLTPLELATFAMQCPSGAKRIAESGGCSLRTSLPLLDLQREDRVYSREDGGLYAVRNVATAAAYPVFAELHADMDTELLSYGHITWAEVSAVLAPLHPIRQAMRTPTRKRQGSVRGAAWYLSRGQAVPPLRMLAGGAS